MEDDEIDSMYEEEKQKAMDDYLKDIEDGKDKEKSQKKYDAKTSKALLTYNKMMEKNIKLRSKPKPSSTGIFSKIKSMIRK